MIVSNKTIFGYFVCRNISLGAACGLQHTQSFILDVLSASAVVTEHATAAMRLQMHYLYVSYLA